MPSLAKYNIAEAADYQPKNLGAIPDGMYKVVIIDSKETKNNKTGEDDINLSLEVTEGDHKGRWLWHRCFLGTDDRDERMKVKHFLYMLCEMFSLPPDCMTEDLHNREFMVKVGTRVDKNDPNKKYNNIKSVHPVPENIPF